MPNKSPSQYQDWDSFAASTTDENSLLDLIQMEKIMRIHPTYPNSYGQTTAILSRWRELNPDIWIEPWIYLEAAYALKSNTWELTKTRLHLFPITKHISYDRAKGWFSFNRWAPCEYVDWRTKTSTDLHYGDMNQIIPFPKYNCN